MSGGRTRIMLVDDHPVVLSGLTAMLSVEDWAEVVAAAGTAADALAAVTEARPDLAVVDLKLPDMDGVELCRRLLAARPGLAVLVLSMYAGDQPVRAALAAGATGYLLKDSEPTEVLAAIRLARRGGLVVTGAARTALATPLGRPSPAALQGLTERERQILDLLVAGLPTAVIARRLQLTPKTVRNRLSEMFAKLGVHGRTEAVSLARDVRHDDTT
jgi:DNA-binding NarL/FixJ family response regulator